jgi:hypothetical protein
VRSLRRHAETELRDDAVLASEWNDVGERADRRHLDERGHPVQVSGAPAQCLHQLQRYADAREVLVG